MRRDPRQCSELSHANLHYHRTELYALDLNMTQLSPTSTLHSAQVPKRPKGKHLVVHDESRRQSTETDRSTRHPQKLLPPIAPKPSHRPDRTSHYSNRSRLGRSAEPRSRRLRKRHHPAKHAPKRRPSPQPLEPTWLNISPAIQHAGFRKFWQ